MQEFSVEVEDLGGALEVPNEEGVPHADDPEDRDLVVLAEVVECVGELAVVHVIEPQVLASGE